MEATPASAEEEVNTQPVEEETKLEEIKPEKKKEAAQFLCGSHMKSADDLLAANIYPVFPAGTKSLL